MSYCDRLLGNKANIVVVDLGTFEVYGVRTTERRVTFVSDEYAQRDHGYRTDGAVRFKEVEWGILDGHLYLRFILMRRGGVVEYWDHKFAIMRDDGDAHADRNEFILGGRL